MNYIAYHTNGGPIFVDSTKVDVSTSLTLSGINYNQYDESYWTNLIHLLENFSSPYEPAHATIGQLWYNNFYQRVNVYTQAGWVNLSPSYDDTTNFARKSGDILNGNLIVGTPYSNTSIVSRSYVESKTIPLTQNKSKISYIKHNNSYMIAQTVITNTAETIQLPEEMIDIKYSVLCTVNTSTEVSDNVYCTVYNKTTNSFKLHVSGVFDSIACVIMGFTR